VLALIPVGRLTATVVAAEGASRPGVPSGVPHALFADTTKGEDTWCSGTAAKLGTPVVTAVAVVVTGGDATATVVPDESGKDGAEIDEVADEDMPARTAKAAELHDEAEKDAMLESVLLTSVLPGKVLDAAATAAAVFAALVIIA
jgi:hypothetical protein